MVGDDVTVASKRCNNALIADNEVFNLHYCLTWTKWACEGGRAALSPSTLAVWFLSLALTLRRVR